MGSNAVQPIWDAPEPAPRRGLWMLAAAAALIGAVGLAIIVTRAPARPATAPITPAETDESEVPASPTTSVTTATTAASALGVADLVLRGNGIGPLAFGAPQADVAQVLRDVLGEPGTDTGPPDQMFTPTLNGCANKSAVAMMFDGLVVGFSDYGDGLVLDGWSAVGEFATEEGLSTSDSLEAFRRRYGDAVVSTEGRPGWEWMRFPGALAMIVTRADGAILVAASDIGGHRLLSAGLNCVADAVAPPATTQPPPIGPHTALDMSAPDPSLTVEPRLVGVYPTVSDASGFPSTFAVPSGDGQIALIDGPTATVRFLDPLTAQVTALLGIAPEVSDTVWVHFGPDDVMYTYQGETARSPAFVAFAPVDGVYVEVARVEYLLGDVPFGAGEMGISVSGAGVVMPYVGADGTPSGSTVASLPITWELHAQTLTIARGTSAWTVYYLNDDCLFDTGGSSFCVPSREGPGDSVVLINNFPQMEDPRSRITLLADVATSWDTDWRYAGPIGDDLLVTRTSDETLEIGIIEIDS